MRVGEVVGLRWCDIDLDEGIVDVNHMLVYYNHGDNKGCSFSVNTPKTKAGERTIPMLGDAKQAFLMEKENLELSGVACKATVECYTDFIIVNRGMMMCSIKESSTRRYAVLSVIVTMRFY